MKRTEITIQLISILLIILWVYTAMSKLMDVEVFRSQLSRQALIGEYAGALVWFIPGIEFIAAILLFFNPTRMAGMVLSFMLMALFTGYVGLAVIGYWENIPCSCGGVLNQLGWKDHLWFNLFFLGVSGTGIYLLRKQHQRGSLKQAAPAGGPA